MINESRIKILVGDTVDSCNAEDCIKIARAVEVLAFYNKNFLDKSITDNSTISRIIQELLFEAEKKIRGE
ncbi:MAG: hypothetical protein NC177_14785, partial [Ruminococcus flavefaciens]|nr:hypothetical protein [Ruminococcus flavefaciens]